MTAFEERNAGLAVVSSPDLISTFTIVQCSVSRLMVWRCLARRSVTRGFTASRNDWGSIPGAASIVCTLTTPLIAVALSRISNDFIRGLANNLAIFVFNDSNFSLTGFIIGAGT